jgi:hypothetical protein
MPRTPSHAAPVSDRAGIEPLSPPRAAVRWSVATRIAFRFGVVYLTLFCLVTQISGSMLPNPSFTYRGLGRLWPVRDITHRVAASVFGITSALDDRSSGEPPFFWIQTFWVLTLSVLAAAIWSFVDRRRESYVTAFGWFRLFVRIALAAALFEYGMTKVIPTQFPAPPLATLVTPVGDLTLSALLWTSIGASPKYEIFTGCIEVLAAILLLLPRTTTLGAMIGLGAALQVFALNMTYDVGLKVISFHLIVLASVLLLPDVPALMDLLVRGRPARLAPDPPLGRTPRARRLLLVAPIVVGLYLLGMYAYINWSFWQVAGGGRPTSALYGIWSVEELSVDGVIAPPHLHDYDRRWRRVIFDAPGEVVVQRTDDSLARYGAALNVERGVLTLTKGASRNWSAGFALERPSPGRLTLEGDMDGHRIQAQLRQVPFDAFPLLNSRFRWMRPH